MRFLVDANVSPRLAELLVAAGHDAVAVRDLGLSDASDDEILDRARAEDRVIVSHDTDFGTLLAFRRLSQPSFILIRSSDPLTPDEQAMLLVANWETIAEDLEAGAIVVFARGHLRSTFGPAYCPFVAMPAGSENTVRTSALGKAVTGGHWWSPQSGWIPSSRPLWGSSGQ